MFWPYEEEYAVDPDESSITTYEYEHVQDHLQGLVDDIYNTGSIEDLEFHLEEILQVFGMKIPQTQPVMVRKPTPQEQSTDRMLKAWVGYTRAYAEMMTK